MSDQIFFFSPRFIKTLYYGTIKKMNGVSIAENFNKKL
jgi:hypothetical protein